MSDLGPGDRRSSCADCCFEFATAAPLTGSRQACCIRRPPSWHAHHRTLTAVATSNIARTTATMDRPFPNMIPIADSKNGAAFLAAKGTYTLVIGTILLIPIIATIPDTTMGMTVPSLLMMVNKIKSQGNITVKPALVIGTILLTPIIATIPDTMMGMTVPSLLMMVNKIKSQGNITVKPAHGPHR
jgi:hypothetical protein